MKKLHKKPKGARLICQLSVLGALGMAAGAYAAPETNATFDPSTRGTGDWGGLRTELFNKGYDFSLEYVAEAGSNLKGGYNDDTTARYSDQFAFGLQLDLQKLLGWHDAEFKLAITERSGRNISNDRIGDPRTGTLSSSMEVWGRGQTWRLTQMWYKQKFFDGKLDIKAGRYGPGEDFNSFPCDFQNLTFCGSQVGNWTGDIWYNWPVSQWALRVKYLITPEFFVQIGAYEQNPSYLETGNSFKLSGSGTKGTIIPVEAVWSPMFNGLPGEYRVGYYKSSANANDVYTGANGQAQPLSGGDFKEHDDKHGWWVVAQQQVTSHGGDLSRGLSVFAQATGHAKATNNVQDYQSVGAIYRGPFDARPKDDLGVAVGRIHVNERLTDRERLENALSGIGDYDNPGYVPVQKTEYNAEIYYGFHVTNWLTLRPNLQYVKNPGGVDQVENAVVAGLKLQSKF